MDRTSNLPAKCIFCDAHFPDRPAVKNHFLASKARKDGVHVGLWEGLIAELISEDYDSDEFDQLRSSRTTRNAEHNAPRNRAGALDYDPADGLPVRKYVFDTVTINQDASTEPTDVANKTNTNESSTIWTELPLPSFFDSLPPHSQQLLRRARMCDPNPPLSVWDRKRNEWVRPEKAKARGLGTDVLKSRHLMNVDLDQDQEDADDDDGDEGSGEEEFGATVPAGKKRKAMAGPEERTIEIKKWVQVPLDKADKMPEPKYLADRRLGMGSLYTPAYLKSVTAFGAGSDGVGMSAGTFDLGDGGGLGNALGGAAAAPSGEATPRRNMPPKRKKKKLGGPGRRKAVPIEQVVVAAGEVQEGQAVEKVVKEGEEVKKEGEEDGEEGSGDETEGEGSEEGR